jgi:hypothetical protein
VSIWKPAGWRGFRCCKLGLVRALASFKYSCFVSYRHGQRAIKQRFIREFYEALSAELELRQGAEVCVDWDRLGGGDFYNEVLARSL